MPVNHGNEVKALKSGGYLSTRSKKLYLRNRALYYNFLPGLTS
jgi:hypothetical protein